jgi:pimeloyl-ACP methyl ester carboxylesterase
MDVSDCYEALQDVITMGLVDRDRVAVIGGSHGGFLTGHMIGQYPDAFQAAVMRNPVLNIPLMSHVRFVLVFNVPANPGRSNALHAVFTWRAAVHSWICLKVAWGSYKFARCIDMLAATSLLHEVVAPCLKNVILKVCPLKVTDIADWCFMEVLGSETSKLNVEFPAPQEVQNAMYRVSPIAYIDAVKTPLMMMLGSQDRRVPHIDGLAYANALRCAYTLSVCLDAAKISSYMSQDEKVKCWYLQHDT